MNELRLLFEKAAVGFKVQVVMHDGSAGEKLPFDPFLEEKDFEDLRWYLEEYMDLPDGGAVVRAGRVEQRLDEWGRRLFDIVFPKGRRDAVDALLARPATSAIPTPDGQHARWELWKQVGKGLVHFSHHIGTTGTNHYESTAVHK